MTGPPDLAGSIVVVISQNGSTPPCVPASIANPDQQCSIMVSDSQGTRALPRCESSSSRPCGTIQTLSSCSSGKEFTVDFGGMVPPGTTAEGVCTP